MGSLRPGRETVAMGFYEDRILPRVVDLALSGKPIGKLRRAVTADLQGEVLEVGFGSGRNVGFYPPEVTRVLAVEPASGGRKLADKRVARHAVAVDYIGLDGADLSLDDASVDHVVSTWTLCTIPDVARALTEIRRVLRPGGTLHFVEHGRSSDAKIARRQDRFTPLQRRIAGGCHLNRPIDTIITEAGLDLTDLETFTAPGPKILNFMYRGVATSSPPLESG